MQLINCKNIFIVVGTVDSQESRFALTDTKIYVPVVTLSVHDNVKLLQ